MIIQVYLCLPFLASRVSLSRVFPPIFRSFLFHDYPVSSASVFSSRPPRRGVLRLKVSRHSQPFPRIPCRPFPSSSPLPSSGASAVLTHFPLFTRFLSGNDYSPLFVISPFRTRDPPLVPLLLHALFNAFPPRRC